MKSKIIKAVCLLSMIIIFSGGSGQRPSDTPEIKTLKDKSDVIKAAKESQDKTINLVNSILKNKKSKAKTIIKRVYVHDTIYVDRIIEKLVYVPLPMIIAPADTVKKKGLLRKLFRW